MEEKERAGCSDGTNKTQELAKKLANKVQKPAESSKQTEQNSKKRKEVWSELYKFSGKLQNC